MYPRRLLTPSGSTNSRRCGLRAPDCARLRSAARSWGGQAGRQGRWVRRDYTAQMYSCQLLPTNCHPLTAAPLTATPLTAAPLTAAP